MNIKKLTLRERSGRHLCAVFLFLLATAGASSAQMFGTLVAFNGANGKYPATPLLQGNDGNLYGTTEYDGAFGGGTIFKITPGRQLTTLYNFCSQPNCADGKNPLGALVQAPNKIFYGTTSTGGPQNGGTVYTLTSTGALTTIYNFCSIKSQYGFCLDGAAPSGGLVLAPDGNFYGTTQGGGNPGNGTLFRITPQGVLTTLYSFCSLGTCTDGYNPLGVVLGTDGNFYGTTLFGGVGPDSVGTVFKITPQGTETTLYSWCSLPNCTDGGFGESGLVEGADGNFYGVRQYGGSFESGTIFQITPTGTLTTIYDFSCTQTGCPDGAEPWGPLVLGSDGNFYGTTNSGLIHCAQNCGTVFKITTQGALTTLHTFCAQTNCFEGWGPMSGVVQATNGKFYGVTVNGGSYLGPCVTYGCGTVFGLSDGLTPFVEASPGFSKVGGSVGILGNQLRGTTSVTFNGTLAEFGVVSGTLLRAVVPSGATTGTIVVTTPGGTLSSNVAFQVLP